MKRSAFAVMLLMATYCHAQTITVGDAIPDKDVETAKQTIEKAQPKVITLGVGEFEVIEPAKGVPVALLWLSTNDVSIQKIEIPAGQAFSTFGVRRGDKVAKHHVFQAKPFAWSVIIGMIQGKNTVTLVRSGEKPELVPIVVDKIDMTIGKPPPKPDDPPDVPVDDDLTKGMRAALAKDKAAGMADSKYLLALSGIYAAASRDSLESIKTAGDLDTLLNSARVAAGIPDPDKVLTETRQFIKRQLLANLTGGVDAPATVMDAAKKQTAKTLMGQIADSLEKIAK